MNEPSFFFFDTIYQVNRAAKGYGLPSIDFQTLWAMDDHVQYHEETLVPGMTFPCYCVRW